MIHNTLYKLERTQKECLLGLGIAFLLLSAIWFGLTLFGNQFPMEPLVVFIGGAATLLASYWPFKPPYSSQRYKGRKSFDYSTKNGLYDIGENSMCFTLKFTKSSDTSIYIYSDPENVKRIALIPNTGLISEVRDVTSLDFSNRAISVQENELVALENVRGYYAIVHIHDIKDSTRPPDTFDEITFSYVINPNGKTDFS